MIVIHKRSGRLRISRNVDSKYEDVARSLRRLQIQPVGENIASVELNNGVIGVAGADMVHVPLVKGAIVEIREGLVWLDNRYVTGAWIIFVEGEHAFRNPGKRQMTERQAEELVWKLHN